MFVRESGKAVDHWIVRYRTRTSGPKRHVQIWTTTFQCVPVGFFSR